MWPHRQRPQCAGLRPPWKQQVHAAASGHLTLLMKSCKTHPWRPNRSHTLSAVQNGGWCCCGLMSAAAPLCSAVYNDGHLTSAHANHTLGQNNYSLTNSLKCTELSAVRIRSTHFDFVADASSATSASASCDVCWLEHGEEPKFFLSILDAACCLRSLFAALTRLTLTRSPPASYSHPPNFSRLFDIGSLITS